MLVNEYIVFYYSEQFIADVAPCFTPCRRVLIRLAMQGFSRSYKLMLSSYKTLLSDLEA